MACNQVQPANKTQKTLQDMPAVCDRNMYDFPTKQYLNALVEIVNSKTPDKGFL